MSYVHGGIEVILTGRIATRTITNNATGTNITQTMVEIKPKDIEEGSFLKWVKPSELYSIIDSKDQINVDDLRKRDVHE